MTEQQTELIKWLNRAFYAERKLNALKRLKESDKARANDISAKHNGDIKGKSDTRQNNVEKILMQVYAQDLQRDFVRLSLLTNITEKKLFPHQPFITI